MPANPPASLPLDHIVIAVGDLQQTTADYQALGFTVLAGGQHPGRTSHNALVVFADGAYLELIAWAAPAPGERWYRVQSAQGDGLVDFALLPQDTAVVLAAAQARGLATLTGPLDGGRLRPDGQRLQWQTARHATPDLPFLCGDITPRALRVPEGEARRHANGARGVAGITVAVHELEASLARYWALLGPEARLGEIASADATGLRRAGVELEGCRLELISPDAASTSSDAEALRQRLATRGEGPCAITLRGEPGRAALGFDPVSSHGVALEIGG